MARLHLSLRYSYVLFVIYVARFQGTTSVANEDRQNYIVYMGALPKGEYWPSKHHMSLLQEVVNRSYLAQSLIRSYTRSFNGFVAHLTNEEQQKLATHEDVVSIFPSETLQLYTTESWDFMGFPQAVHRNLSIENDIIIGVIDTGIWPESESFNDHGFGPIPKKWKGACNGGNNFTCNNKIIGARHYSDYTDSARDFYGHGTHTAATVAGNTVENASYYGIANGTARGAVPSARIAVYTVCSLALGCKSEDILAGFDDAIADGVDILTVSLGPRDPKEFEDDPIAIGSFHAVDKGILTVNAAGNNGFTPGRIASNAPWLFTVAASNTNRRIISKVVLLNGTTLVGNAVNSFKLKGSGFPIITGVQGSRYCEEPKAESCFRNCLQKDLVEGNIILCRSSDATREAWSKGAVGLIMLADELDDVPLVSPFATSVLSKEQFELVENYQNSTKDPKLTILQSEVTQNLVAPVVAFFSSRGPNPIVGDILKPDISAPGVDILAAFSPYARPSGETFDQRSVPFNILSGTSMACPHVTGAAAYVKSFHPNWSPSAIKSALMTTSWRMNATSTKYGDAEFSYGAGHIDPLKALSPGLVYETFKEDYVKMICGLNVSSSSVIKIFGDNINCTDVVPTQARDLNYPSMAAQVVNSGGFTVEFHRTVTNVGLANSTYKATLTNASDWNITVIPNTLSFKELNEKKSFVVTVVGENMKNMISASLEWSDGIHTARSPIVVYT